MFVNELDCSTCSRTFAGLRLQQVPFQRRSNRRWAVDPISTGPWIDPRPLPTTDDILPYLAAGQGGRAISDQTLEAGELAC